MTITRDPSADERSGDEHEHRDDPVAATSTPDAPTSTWRKLRRREGRWGLWPALFVLVFPHFWIGIGLAVAAVVSLALPLMGRTVEGRVVEVRHEIAIVEYVGDDGARERAQVEIDVDAAAPDVIELRVIDFVGKRYVQKPAAPFFPLVGFALFWNFVVGVFVHRLALQPLWRWWLMKRGVSAAGVVEELTDYRVKRTPWVRVRYSFPTHAGTFEGTMEVPSKDATAAGLRLSSRVSVLHHPTRPKWSVVSELTSWEPAAQA